MLSASSTPVPDIVALSATSRATASWMCRARRGGGVRGRGGERRRGRRHHGVGGHGRRCSRASRCCSARRIPPPGTVPLADRGEREHADRRGRRSVLRGLRPGTGRRAVRPVVLPDRRPLQGRRWGPQRRDQRGGAHALKEGPREAARATARSSGAGSFRVPVSGIASGRLGCSPDSPPRRRSLVFESGRPVASLSSQTERGRPSARRVRERGRHACASPAIPGDDRQRAARSVSHRCFRLRPDHDRATVPGTANPYLAGMPVGSTCCAGRDGSGFRSRAVAHAGDRRAALGRHRAHVHRERKCQQPSRVRPRSIRRTAASSSTSGASPVRRRATGLPA